MTIFPTGKPHISFSEVKTWKECSWKHKLVYINKIDMFKPSPYLDFGTILHTEAEGYLKNKTFDLARLESSIRKSWSEKEFEKVDTWLKEAFQILQDIPSFLDTQFPEWEFVSAEHQLYESIENQEIKFKGFVDAMIRVKNKKGKEYLWLIDWKTSGPRGWDSAKRRDTLVASQLVLYKTYIAKKFEIDTKDIKCGFVLLKRGLKPGKACELIEVSVGPKTAEKAEKLVSSMITSVKKGVFLKNRSSCKYCDFKNTPHCPGSSEFSVF